MMRWPHPIQAVAFDMDGLLVNTEDLYTEVGETILRRRGRQFSRELKKAMMGLPGPQAWAVMIAQEALRDTVESLASESDAIFVELLPAKLKAMPGLDTMLDYLDHRRLPRCVATSSRRSFAQQVLQLIDRQHRFDFIVTAEDVPRGKPSPDIYQAAAERMEVAAHALLVLEDSHHGSQAGIAAGACTVAVPGDHSLDHDFTGAHYRASSLGDPKIIEILAAHIPDHST